MSNMDASFENEPLDDAALLEEIVLALVSRPDDVRIEQEAADGIVHLTIHVAKVDLGKVIGRSGETISLMRKLIGRIAASRGEKVNIQVYEPNKTRRVYSGRNVAA